MTCYFDPNHPQQLIEALRLIYGLEKGQPRSFRIYDSKEYDKVPADSVFFLVDEEEGGLEINTKRLAEEGYTVFAIKFPSEEYYVPFEIAEAILKMWSRALKHIVQDAGQKLWKYHWHSDQIRPVISKT